MTHGARDIQGVCKNATVRGIYAASMSAGLKPVRKTEAAFYSCVEAA